MPKFTKEQIEKHIKTHSEKSSADVSAVTTLKHFLRADGKFNFEFSENDKWPNVDGRFELVSCPSVSRVPCQIFFAQIKGTVNAKFDENGSLHYQLKNLSFPAFIYNEVTLDPCILFVVINSNKRNGERVFWKYMSVDFLESLNFDNESATIIFSNDLEIYNTDESVDAFAGKLKEIADNHSFSKRLAITEYTKENVTSLIKSCNALICEDIEKLATESRDNISKRMLTKLDDLCVGTLLLHSFAITGERTTLRFAWELSLTDVNTKFLATFLQSLRYIDRRVPQENQSERLMLKYYDFLWQIRKYLHDFHAINILCNLEKFPLNLDEEDKKYYKLVSDTIGKTTLTHNAWSSSRYFVHKKTPFYIGKERYFEVVLQLASIYATKFNRITVFTKENITTNYAIQVGYVEANLKLWDVVSKIKVITNWRVSIEPSVLNSLAEILRKDLRINSRHGEYLAFMDYLTKSGINLLDLIDFEAKRFDIVINAIYEKTNTKNFKEILVLLKRDFSERSFSRAGRNVIRYILIRLNERMIQGIMVKSYNSQLKDTNLLLSSRCYPFDRNPLLYDLPNSKTTGDVLSKDLVRAVSINDAKHNLPYLRVRKTTETTGEIYINKDKVGTDEEIRKYNRELDVWDKKQGKSLRIHEEKVYIESYEQDSIAILKKLLELEKVGYAGQAQLNNKFLKDNGKEFDPNMGGDENKKHAIKKAFLDSKVMMIYGSAGTGKTTLMNYISDLMHGRTKVFLAKTHAAVENLKTHIKSPGHASTIMGVDKFIKSNTGTEYDVVFVDECSIIDNRTMKELITKIDDKSLLVCVGDIYQIGSIDFGNWFLYAKDILSEKSIVELNNTWRTKSKSLLDLWNEVRYQGKLITEKLVIDGPFSENISEKLFSQKEGVDEIILCLNYDGRFGLNNINNYFQDANKNKEFIWHEWKYKVGDPILFNASERFPALYNNLKGKIVRIDIQEEGITFTVDVNGIVTEQEISRCHGLEGLEWFEDKTRVCFTVFEKHGGASEEERELSRMESVIPFQLAYAVSIHKSQGLEYDSVKVVIPKSNSENVSHGIFYTAITRPKEKLKIFWSAEIMKKIIGDFETQDKNSVTLKIIKQKLSEDIRI